MRWVMTRVFPLPAPARISRGPSVWLTASRCGAFSPSRNSMSGRHFHCSTRPGRLIPHPPKRRSAVSKETPPGRPRDLEFWSASATDGCLLKESRRVLADDAHVALAPDGLAADADPARGAQPGQKFRQSSLVLGFAGKAS